MPGLLEVLLFVGLTILAVAASIHSFRSHETYGFFRFIGFELLSLLVVWNARHWFRDPLSPAQLVSWSVIAASTVLAIHGGRVLRAVGGARSRVIEGTVTIVEAGVYRFIRHPLYASLLYAGWGVFFKGLDLVSGALAVAASAAWFATARYEERFNVDRFGTAYSDYRRRTRMFFPFLL